VLLISDFIKGEVYSENCSITVIDEILDSRPKRNFPDEPEILRKW